MVFCSFRRDTHTPTDRPTDQPREKTIANEWRNSRERLKSQNTSDHTKILIIIFRNLCAREKENKTRTTRDSSLAYALCVCTLRQAIQLILCAFFSMVFFFFCHCGCVYEHCERHSSWRETEKKQQNLWHTINWFKVYFQCLIEIFSFFYFFFAQMSSSDGPAHSIQNLNSMLCIKMSVLCHANEYCCCWSLMLK